MTHTERPPYAAAIWAAPSVWVTKRSLMPPPSAGRREHRPLPLPAADLDPPAMRLDDLFALKKSDAEALLLRGPERPEEVVPDEGFRHADTVVLDREGDHALAAAGPHPHEPALAHGVAGVQDQVQDHLPELLRVDGGDGLGEVLLERDRSLQAPDLGEHLPCQTAEVGGLPLQVELLGEGLELGDQAVHPRDRAADRLDEIALEVLLDDVLLGVLHHQREGVGEVLEVVEDERGDLGDRRHLPRLGEFLGEPEVVQGERGLAADDLHQVEVLVGEPLGNKLRAEDHERLDLFPDDQRHDQPRPRAPDELLLHCGR